jgi:hypothetical protein
MGSRLLRIGSDPYLLIGPGKPIHWNFPFLYPATAVVAMLPLSLLSMHTAALCFVFVSSALLTFGISHDGWHRLPILASAAFIDSTLGAQWSSLLVAGVFLPAVCFVASAKPQVGIGVIGAAASRKSLAIAAAGALALSVPAFVILPRWFSEWVDLVRAANHLKAALVQPGGFLILIALVRWRRPEAWAILLISAIPQTLMWYSFLILIAFATTYREACALSVISSIGYVVYHQMLDHMPDNGSTLILVWWVVILTTYLPCVLVIVRRPQATHKAATQGRNQHSVYATQGWSRAGNT